MESEDDLDILTALLEESEGVEEQQHQQDQDQGQADDLDNLFDEENDGEEYKEDAEETKDQLSELFGDVEDVEQEENKDEVSESLNKSKEDLQDELKRMQEEMQKLQHKLAMSQKASSKPPVSPKTPLQQKTLKPNSSKPDQLQKGKSPGEKMTRNTPSLLKKVQESSDFSEQLNNADSFKRKPRVAHQPSTSPESRGPLVEIKLGSSFLPVETTASNPLRSSSFNTRAEPGPSLGTFVGANRPSALPVLPQDVSIEKYSGLRLRKPRVSSTEMDRRMTDRRLIRLSQVPERLAREKLEDSDWVTFAVVVSKATPQSSSSGKTFSVWKLNDLHNMEVFVSLLLFGEVHKEHWKTETGSVIGLLNPNPMKQKDGYDGVSLTVDHPQKVLLLGEAQDFGTCKGVKKNGEPCSQIVNIYECQFCQYHVKAQYKKMSSKRAELQSSYSGKAPNKLKGKGVNLREKLCQNGFYYGGVSSAACAASIGASKPNKSGQTTLDKLFIRGSAQHVAQAKRLALQSGNVSGCSDEFKGLMSAPTPGALQLKKHLTHNQTAVKNTEGVPVQSISASDLLKQQKQKQRDLLTARRQRNALLSPKGASEVPKCAQGPALPSTSSTSSTSSAPTLGRGFSEGDDILFFDNGPLSPPTQTSPSLSAAKLSALKKLRAKGTGLEKEDPNAVKRKRSSSNDINVRVENNRSSPKSGSSNEEESAQKKRKTQQEYIESEEFQKILKAKSRHNAVLQAAEYQLQERYFDALVKKEQMEDKMKGIREMKCRAVTCKNCKYTYFKPADRCVGENHALKWHDAVKRFFKCPCGQRSIALDRLPNKHCSNCGLFKWERDGMFKEKSGPKIGGELLLPRGEEHGKFLNSK